MLKKKKNKTHIRVVGRADGVKILMSPRVRKKELILLLHRFLKFSDFICIIMTNGLLSVDNSRSDTQRNDRSGRCTEYNKQ